MLCRSFLIWYSPTCLFLLLLLLMSILILQMMKLRELKWLAMILQKDELPTTCVCLVTQSRPTLYDSMDYIPCQAPLSMGILQAKILEWVAMLSSRRSSQPRDWTRSPTLQAGSLPPEPPEKPITVILSTQSNYLVVMRYETQSKFLFDFVSCI